MRFISFRFNIADVIFKYLTLSLDYFFFSIFVPWTNTMMILIPIQQIFDIFRTAGFLNKTLCF